MKIEKFSIKNKGEIFDKANPMHDCDFTATFENNTLILFFDHLDLYYDGFPPVLTHWFEGCKKVTIKYYDIDCIELTLKRRKKELHFYDTVTELENKKLTMYRYWIDCFDDLFLDFYVNDKKKTWEGRIEICPTEIEYIWE